MSHPDLDEEAFALLQRCAVPLKDDLNSVVKRVALFYLNAHADQLDAGGRYTVEVDGEPHTRIGKAVQEMATERGIGIIRRSKAVLRKRWLQQFIDQGFFDGARGARLPIGLPLHAEYQGHKFEAKVTAHGIMFNGAHYDNPSAAAVAAKKSCGASPTTAQSNGWTFWNIGRGSSQGMEPLNVLRNPLVTLTQPDEVEFDEQEPRHGLD